MPEPLDALAKAVAEERGPAAARPEPVPAAAPIAAAGPTRVTVREIRAIRYGADGRCVRLLRRSSGLLIGGFACLAMGAFNGLFLSVAGFFTSTGLFTYAGVGAAVGLGGLGVLLLTLSRSQATLDRESLTLTYRGGGRKRTVSLAGLAGVRVCGQFGSAEEAMARAANVIGGVMSAATGVGFSTPVPRRGGSAPRFELVFQDGSRVSLLAHPACERILIGSGPRLGRFLGVPFENALDGRS